MFYDIKVMNSKLLGQAWKAATLEIPPGPDDKTCLPEICDNLTTLVTNDGGARSRLSLRSSSILTGGAARLYQQGMMQLFKDAGELVSEITIGNKRKTFLSGGSISESSTNSVQSSYSVLEDFSRSKKRRLSISPIISSINTEEEEDAYFSEGETEVSDIISKDVLCGRKTGTNKTDSDNSSEIDSERRETDNVFNSNSDDQENANARDGSIDEPDEKNCDYSSPDEENSDNSNQNLNADEVNDKEENLILSELDDSEINSNEINVNNNINNVRVDIEEIDVQETEDNSSKRDQEVQTSISYHTIESERDENSFHSINNDFNDNLPFGLILVHNNYNSRIPSKIIFSSLNIDIKNIVK